MSPEFYTVTEATPEIEARATYAAEMLFLDADKFKLYETFRDSYVGERGLKQPDVIRSRGGVEVLYDHPLLSGITLAGSHLLHVSAGHSNRYPGVDGPSQFFVATADFDTLNITEWWVDKVVSNDVNKPRKLILYLNEHPSFHDVLSKSEPQSEPQSRLERNKAEVDRIYAEKFADYMARKITFENGRVTLSWGGGNSHDTFHTFDQLKYDLLALHQEELLQAPDGGYRGHNGVREYFTAA